MENDRKCLSVIIPVYFNETSLQALYQELVILEANLAEEYGMGLELIFIDDGSGDRSFEELLAIRSKRPSTKVLKLTRNFGSVEASSLGFHYASGDCCSILSADLQDPPAQLLKMVGEWRGGSKFVLSRRRTRKDPLLTKVFARIYYIFVYLLVFKDYPKGGFDLMLFDKQILPYLKDLNGQVNYQLYLFWLGFKATILESDRVERHGGKSRWTFAKKVNHFINSIAGFSVKPLRLISGIGMFVSLLSFSYGLFVFIAALINEDRLPGFAAIYVLVSFFGGIFVAMLSIIGEYIWRIFELANNKPTRVIDEMHM